jgi:hypothetical protein
MRLTEAEQPLQDCLSVCWHAGSTPVPAQELASIHVQCTGVPSMLQQQHASMQHHILRLWTLSLQHKQAHASSPDKTTQAVLCMHHLSLLQQLLWTCQHGMPCSCAGWPHHCSYQACRLGQCSSRSCMPHQAA